MTLELVPFLRVNFKWNELTVYREELPIEGEELPFEEELIYSVRIQN